MFILDLLLKNIVNFELKQKNSNLDILLSNTINNLSTFQYNKTFNLNLITKVGKFMTKSPKIDIENRDRFKFTINQANQSI
ncbi:hypothetical protein BpHYR1_048380 [Brachionus plicatilis]|uniref:Uncharacterized protein n=1 Tax=Brachionus plicatilis TaxID=10195 RepID=A0A3M7QEW8_BRAPC|nr:hypothetical protein BpHYR1_048380 [Brachionus plicatilis]